MTFASTATPAAPLAGETAATLGAASDPQMKTGVSSVRGAGEPAMKSAALLSVSVQPDPARNAAVVLLNVGAGPAPSKKFAPSYPIRSTIVASAAGVQGVEPPLQPRGVAVFTSATLPPVALMFMGVASVRNGPGRGAPVAPPLASSTSRYWPGDRDPLSGVMRFVALPKFPVPVALAYWSDQPVRSTSALLRLNSST